MMVAEVRGKEDLYQNIIREKDEQIEEMKARVDEKSKKKRKNYGSDNDSIDSEEYHKIKHELRENENKLRIKNEENSALTDQNNALYLKSKEVNSNLELCLS